MSYCYWKLSEHKDFYIVTCTKNIWILGLHNICPKCGEKVTENPNKKNELVEFLKTMTEKEKEELLKYYYEILGIKPLNTTVKQTKKER